MRIRDLMPALAMATLVPLAMAPGRLLPEGDTPVLVRLGNAGLERLLRQPSLAEVRLLALPAPGYAVLRGDTALIRSTFGSAVAWQGVSTCSPDP
ncbi:hypothetical protein M0638_07495 [Roseomonas sp. NAR14]|uniref:Pilus formation protein N-terminal domain-containing protein n=1 Tax=Roseomonas acroporae TaxID=2937791 RepID=A0A9X1Y8I8_9PROT|nr:hypothetical protein [Roseomonas acroporae]MCK8784220.1 hypothetical protein [Roseomonas acroporae]